MRAFITATRGLLEAPEAGPELREEINAHIEARRERRSSPTAWTRARLAAAARAPVWKRRRALSRAGRARRAASRRIESIRAETCASACGCSGARRCSCSSRRLSIAGGVGGGIAGFTIANAIIFRPIAGGVDLYRIYTSARSGEPFNNNSHADFLDFATATQAFSSMCATKEVHANLEARGAAAMRSGAILSGDCFRTLGLRPHAGRLIAPARGPDVVISYALWKRQIRRGSVGDRHADPAERRRGRRSSVSRRGASAGRAWTSAPTSGSRRITYRTLLPAGALQDRRDRRFTRLRHAARRRVARTGPRRTAGRDRIRAPTQRSRRVDGRSRKRSVA
jgi:hypothetical protein